jgi:hypothetical protein
MTKMIQAVNSALFLGQLVIGELVIIFFIGYWDLVIGHSLH